MTQIATTIEQSKYLLELGLSPKTADMVWVRYAAGGYRLEVLHRELFERIMETDIAAWSFSALLDVMPKKETPYIQYLNEPPFDKEEYRWECGLSDLIGSPGSSPIEASFQMMCWLLENGYIEKGGAS
jgi:hypothetical protein